MLYCVNKVKFEKQKGFRTAGKKAPDDIALFAEEYGAKVYNFTEVDFRGNPVLRVIKNTFVSAKNWLGLRRVLRDGDVIILQHPYEGLKLTKQYLDLIRKRRNVKFVLLIHDLNALRTEIDCKQTEAFKEMNSGAELSILKTVDHIICHNESMKAYMIERLGLEAGRISCLELFDYYHECKLPQERPFGSDVAVAGNLSKDKCGYLYKLFETGGWNFRLHLYGPNFDDSAKNENVVYHGLMGSDELPGKLEGAFGLVWDGNETDGCAGNAGEYIKYNNPHKCSLFIASGIPVIIWKQAALAPFVEENGVGITVESLLDIDEATAALTEEKYSEMAKNAAALGEKLRHGYYFKKALDGLDLQER